MYEFMQTRKKLWEELFVLSSIEIKTEGQRDDECIKSRLFWELEPVERSLKNPILPWLADGLTPIQRRIMESVCKNSSI